VAAAVLDYALDHSFRTVVELGAGTAPLTRILAEDRRAKELRFVVCDLVPDRVLYRDLEQRYPGRVTARTESVDFRKGQSWEPATLLVVSAAMHHVPADERPGVIETLNKSADGVMVFAPVRKSCLSLLLSGLAVFPAFCLPVCYLGRRGRLRRLLWCWLVPLVPAMVLWDAIGGCLRQWTDSEWREALLRQLGNERGLTIQSWTCGQMVAW
jgi:hypothetical protein